MTSSHPAATPRRPTRIEELAAAVPYGLVGAAISAAAMSLALWSASVTSAAFAVHAVVVPMAFVLVSLVYFRRQEPLRPMVAGLVFGGLALATAGFAAIVFHRSIDLRASVLGAWLPAYAALAATWITGLAMAEHTERTSTHSA